MDLMGEFLCTRKELQDIPITTKGFGTTKDIFTSMSSHKYDNHSLEDGLKTSIGGGFGGVVGTATNPSLLSSSVGIPSSFSDSGEFTPRFGSSGEFTPRFGSGLGFHNSSGFGTANLPPSPESAALMGK